MTGVEKIATKRDRSGFSLVELLIAMGLGVFLTSVMAYAYVSARQSGAYDEQILIVQENARFALRLLSREFAAAGFQGALTGVDEVSVPLSSSTCAAAGWSMNRSRPLQVVDNYMVDSVAETADGEILDCLDLNSVGSLSDILTFRRSAQMASVRNSKVSDSLLLSSTETWFLRVENSVAAEWQKLELDDLPSIAAAESSTVSYWQAIARIVFVREYSHIPGDNVPALCMKTLAGTQMTTRCQVEGIENLQVQFGLDTDSDGVPDVYRSSPDEAQMRQAVTARIHLLVRSIKAVSNRTDESTYRLGSVLVAPQLDRYVRRVFTTTIPLRNLASGFG